MTDNTQTFEEKLEKVLLEWVEARGKHSKLWWKSRSESLDIAEKELKQLFLAEALAAKPEKKDYWAVEDKIINKNQADGFNLALDEYEKNLRERLK